jgi:hypothetical protein
MQKIHSVIVLYLILFFFFKPASAQINTESLESYWNIVDSLKADKIPSIETWDDFFAKEGNQVAFHNLRNSRRMRDTIVDYLQLVYLPSRRDELLKRNYSPFLENILFVRDREVSIKEYVSFLKKSSLVDSMYKLAYQYLPANKRSKVPDLKIYYIGPLTINAQASKNVIFIDIGSDFRYSTKRKGIVGAHELHHLLVGGWKPKKADALKYFLLLRTLESLMKEGVADLIDKKYISEEDTFFNSLNPERFSMSDSLVIQLNSELERLSKSTETRPLFRPMIRSGHVPGHYMALVIERNGYLPELINNMHDPFAFVYIYNKAAKKDELKPLTFSASAISYLKGIELLCQ